ncbi:anti-sigma factor family protein [Acidicapsa ligni]|uniref:anti-sigma factor family protein n=1 Tax=Acidicapsa ligni TaxID=542300 RepID=UPI0021E00E7D|nr:zf-HC2 domain-containing protein [Acidicapsa ligni]
MAERENTRTHIPNSPACGQWETLLVDALDGLLRPEDEAVFSNHMATCSACTAMFEQVRRGREWLEFLAPEPEVPAYLLDRILIETGHGKMDAANLAVAGGEAVAGSNVIAIPPVWQRPGFTSSVRRFAEPRLLMTAAMAFFSIALTISLTGVRISSISMADIRPTSVRSMVEKRIMTASTPIVRYYDHLRFVYEVESRMRELRRANEIQQQSQPKSRTQPTGGEGESHKKDGGSLLDPKSSDPNQAPLQTVNPPSTLWSDEPLQARLELPARLQPQSNKMTGYHKPTEASGSSETSELAMPDRSSICIA